MSKELKAFNKALKQANTTASFTKEYKENVATVKKALKASETLEIIKKKRLSLLYFIIEIHPNMQTLTYDYYCNWIRKKFSCSSNIEDFKYTQEEFELVKEVLL